MGRYPVFVCVLLGFCLSLFAQEEGGRRPPESDEERAARRAMFMQRMQENGGIGGEAQRAVGATISTEQTAPEGGELATVRTPDASSDVAVNWENITLKDCIEVLCRDLGMEFVISPSVNVAQEVSVRAGDVTKWAKEDKIELFDAVLETAGVQRVERGRVWVFAPSDIRPIVEGWSEKEYSDGKPVIGVIRLKSVDASQAEEFLNTVGGKPQRVFSVKGSRMILVLGTQQYLTQMEKLVKLIDFPAGVLKPYMLEMASSDDVAQELTSLFYGRTGGDGSEVRFISVSRLNTVVAHNVPESMLEELDHWIAVLDQADEENERVTKIYRLQVISSDVIAGTLDNLYSSLYKQEQALQKQQSTTAQKAKNSSKTQSATASKTTGSSKTAAKQTAAKTSKSAPSSSPSMDEEAIILSDEETNTLIINATPDQHRDIERTIQQLDRARRQVLIETVLVEVTLDDGTDLGVEWAATKGLSSAGLQSGIGSSISGLDVSSVTDNGLSYLLKSSNEKWAFIQAAQSENRLQVLSSPTVLTRDGMEATVSFGDEVPIQEKSTSGTSGSTDNYSYSYQDAKITLTVTPVIDDNRMVTLDLTQSLRQVPADYTIEVSEDSDVVLPPIFTTRELSSSLQVDDGQTLILGGLIQRKDQKIKSGIPLLCKTPLIGWLFGRIQTKKVGSEILMILTPHVVDTRDETDLLTRDFRQKILGAMSEKDIRSLYDLSDSEAPVAAEKE